MKNPYEVLGVAKGAGDAEIKAAYRKMVLKYHPDKNPGDKATEEKFKEAGNAYDILKDPQKRAAYDQFGDAAFGAGNGSSARGGNPFGGGAFHFDMNGFDVSDMMEEVMRGFGFNVGGGRQSAGSEMNVGRDMLHELSISLEDAFAGTAQTVGFQSRVKCEKCNGFGTADGKPAPVCKTCRGSGYVRGGGMFFATERPCPDCHGLGRVIKDKCRDCDGTGVVVKKRTIEIKIPAGIEDGTRLRLAGQGEAAAFGGQAGDFYVDIRVRSHPVFKRSGRDLFMTAVVPFAMLALGGEVDISTIDGKVLGVKISSGTQIGDQLRIKGRGMPAGDLYIEIKTVVPVKLNAKQKKALKELL